MRSPRSNGTDSATSTPEVSTTRLAEQPTATVANNRSSFYAEQARKMRHQPTVAEQIWDVIRHPGRTADEALATYLKP